MFDSKIVLKDMKDIYDRKYAWKVFENSTVLVTGAYGMLASYLVFFFAYLNIYHNMNIEIYAQGRNKKKAIERFGRLVDYSWFQIITDDISQPIKRSFKFDYIIHAAGVANPRLYSTNPVDVIEPNVMGTYYLLKSAYESSCKGFLLFSTGDVYGCIEGGGDIFEETYGVINPLDIHSCYGESKRLAETLCMAFYKQYGIPIRIARIAHTYGPTMNPYEDPRVFASFMRCILEGRDIEILSSGEAKRPFCYLADATAAFLLLLINGQDGEAYNVSNTKEFLSINQLADIMIKINCEKEIKVIHKMRETTDTYTECSMNKDNKPIENKLKKLGWVPHYDTFNGMLNTYNYFKE